MQLTAQPDGTITKTDILTANEVGRLIADHQAAIAGAQASIKSFTDSKNAEIAAHQAELSILTPAKSAADLTLNAIAVSATPIGP